VRQSGINIPRVVNIDVSPNGFLILFIDNNTALVTIGTTTNSDNRFLSTKLDYRQVIRYFEDQKTITNLFILIFGNFQLTIKVQMFQENIFFHFPLNYIFNFPHSIAFIPTFIT